MDLARNLFNHHRPRSSRRWCWRNIKCHCGSLRVDCRYFVHHQPLIVPIASEHSLREAVLLLKYSHSFLLCVFLRAVSTPLEIIQRKIALLMLMILLLTMIWSFSLFGQAAFPGAPHNGGFTYILSVLIVILIIVKSLSYL